MVFLHNSERRLQKIEVRDTNIVHLKVFAAPRVVNVLVVLQLIVKSSVPEITPSYVVPAFPVSVIVRSEFKTIGQFISLAESEVTVSVAFPEET